MYTWRALQLHYFCSWSLALVLSWTSHLIFGSRGFGVPCWLVSPLGSLGLARDLQQNTQGYSTNYRNNNRHLIKISSASHPQGGGGRPSPMVSQLALCSIPLAYGTQACSHSVTSAVACHAFPSVIPRDPCVVGVVKKRRGGSISAGECKILKKGKGKQTICKKYETMHLPRRCGGGGVVGVVGWWPVSSCSLRSGAGASS